MISHLALREPASLGRSPLSDEEVVMRVRAGDTALYEVLMRRYNQRLFRSARAILRNEEEAEDVLQETYVRAYASLAQFAGRAQFSTWLMRIAIHEALSRLRRRKSRPVVSAQREPGQQRMERLRSPNPDPEQQALRHETVSLLERAVDALPGKYRCVFVLREIEGLSTSETATCLELSEETVKIRLLRARQRLRQELYTRVGATSSQAFQFLGTRCDHVVQQVLEQLSR